MAVQFSFITNCTFGLSGSEPWRISALSDTWSPSASPALGSVPNSNSCKLVSPSPSLSWLASAGSPGLRPCWRSKSSSISSLSASVGITEMAIAAGVEPFCTLIQIRCVSWVERNGAWFIVTKPFVVILTRLSGVEYSVPVAPWVMSTSVPSALTPITLSWTVPPIVTEVGDAVTFIWVKSSAA